ncbi:hypothetical protein HG536_0F04090 [Torulaspora globosa]|uniref:Uncharacterized protein n=1 Tax=Torulaspora globosa TaxID=48254 RepID=A0A7G3ZKP7_9SACH|nr:uncharacterized protein HG536_0F04090 [Torulaspora globosa]QLL34083.1 hypothetical protein HG536_0F04090 [Torulaspora globosa]
MLAKAAAGASAPTLRGSVYLDSHDVKIIQYKAAIYKLGEMTRLLNILEKNLERTGSSKIIPLVNYMLSLCEGPLFNVHPILRKRYQLLCEFKACKVTPILPALSTSQIDLKLEFPPFIRDRESLRSKIYDDELQWKLLGCLQKVLANCTTIYERRLRQIQLERNAMRPADTSGRSIPLDLNAVEDLLRPQELSLSLDLAVLINDAEQDTTTRSLLKLQTQVLAKFALCLQSKVLPVIRGYYNQLHTFCASRGISAAAVKELQYWQYSLHRIYALMLRALYIFDVMMSLTTQIYFPNRSYLNDIKTRLLSQNVFSYQEALQRVEELCDSSEHAAIAKLVTALLDLSKQNVAYHVQPGKILELYQNSLSQVVPFLRTSTQTLSEFAEMWTYIEGNLEAQNLINGYEASQLRRMLDERLEADRLTHIERRKVKSSIKEPGSPLKGSSTPNSRHTLRRNLVGKSNGSSNSSVSSTGPSSPGTMSPLRMSRTNSVDVQSSNPLGFASPQVSRRGSIAESRLPTSINASKATMDQKSTPRSPLANRRIMGRPRSSSLQSALESNRKTRQGPASPSRSNSLQADATVNQKIIQEAVSKSFNGAGKVGSPLSKVQTRTTLNHSPSPDDIRCESPASELEKLTLNPEDNQNKEDDFVQITVSSDYPSIASKSNLCIKKVRFIGVPPLDEKEDKSPKRRGWYKKPAVLHYPPPPPQFAVQKYKMRQEGMAFRTSLREEDTTKKSNLLLNLDISQPRDSATQKIASKLRDKLR